MSVLQNDARSTSKYVKILNYSGASALIIHNSFVRTNKFNTRKSFENKWFTMTALFLMLCKAEVKIKLPEFYFTAHIFAPFHITSQKSNYIHQDLLQRLGVNLDFQNKCVGWKETKISMKSINCEMLTNFAMQVTKNIKNATNRIKKILDAKYEFKTNHK